MRVYENVAKYYALSQKIFLLKNICFFSDNFGLTKSCYWTVSNFLDPCTSETPTEVIWWDKI